MGIETIFNPQIIFSSIKLLALIGLGVYVVFSIILVRQEQLMSNVLEETFEPILRIITLLHLFASIGVFIAALILL